MKNNTLNIVVIILYLLIFTMPVYAIDLTGTRPMGMGGAFVGVADDANSVFWNPAGMKQFKDNAFESNFHFDEDNTYPRGSLIMVNSQKSPALDGGVGFSRHRAVINGIGYDKTDILIALADQYAKNFSIGLSGKYVYEDGQTNKNALSLDAGAIIVLGDSIKLGITGFNLNDPSLDSYKRKVQAGVQIKFGKILSVSGDGARLFSKGSLVKYNYNLGGEAALGETFFLRGGYSEEKIYDNRYVSGGVGMIISNATVNYAYVHDLDSGLRERHLSGISYVF